MMVVSTLEGMCHASSGFIRMVSAFFACLKGWSREGIEGEKDTRMTVKHERN